MNKEEQAYSRMVDKVKGMTDEAIKATWDAIQSPGCHPEDGYNAGDGIVFPFDYWADLIYSEMQRRQ
jgi:hypothetical protein